VVFPNQFTEQTTDLFKECKAHKNNIGFCEPDFIFRHFSPLPVAVELEQLLVKQSSLEIYFEWLDSLIERKVCEVSVL